MDHRHQNSARVVLALLALLFSVGQALSHTDIEPAIPMAGAG